MKKNNFSFREFWMKYQTIIIFIVMIGAYTLISPNFFTAVNLKNIFSQNACLIVVCMAQLLAQVIGGVDLSVSAVVAFSGVTTALYMTEQGFSFALAATVSIAFGMLMGMLNGLLIAKGKFAPFIATLATTQVAKGITYVICNARIIYVDEPAFNYLGGGAIGVVPVVVLVAFVIVILMHIVLTRTTVGRRIMALGGSEETARLAGVNVTRYKFLLYTAAGALSGIAGVMAACRLGAGSPTIGAEWEMDSIAAVVIGGTISGAGSAINTLLGALIIGWMKNILNLIGLASYPQFIIKGAIIIVAVLSQKLGTGDVRLFKTRKIK